MKKFVTFIIVACFILLSIFTSTASARCSSCTPMVSTYKNPGFFNQFFWKLIRSLTQFEIQSEVSTYEKKISCKNHYYLEEDYAVRYEENYPASVYSKCAVIIGGGTGSSDSPEISYYAHKIYIGLKKKGFSDKNIYYVSAQKKEGVDAFSNKENTRYALKYWLRSHSGSLTSCYIFLLGHGNHRKDEGLLLLGQGYIGESDIAKWIKGLSYKKCLIMVGCCAASYFKDGLSGKNREILVPSRYYATTQDIAILIDKALSKVETDKGYKKLLYYHLPLPYGHIKPQRLLKIKIL
ncbi:MAG: hypothetical protein FE038_00485 [Thermoplasmata archaeon]|nr:MAG: hypothetical protein FE038_00485 [Thermoplasmata archaeon]RLF61970.1 MAG: hypothetical protein DRN16_02775 [Thermoplasmata archaeon]